MPDVFDVLGEDHNEVKQLLARLEKERPGHDAGKRKLADRKEKATTLITDESEHEAVEEMFFWPAVRDKLPDGDKLARHATSQENEAKKVLAKLSTMDAGSPEFEKLLTEFTAAAREHIEFEETKVWPRLRGALSRQEATEIGRQVKDGKKTVPDKPQPGKTVPGKTVPAQSRDSGGKSSGDAADKTKSELYEEARRLGVQGRSTMTKDELAHEVADHR
jgi:hemerythrin-like domain-containing protein